MDLEHIEIQLEEAKMLQRFGFMNIQHYLEHKEHVVSGLVMYGDMFVMALGYALKEADVENSVKIMRYWAQTCEQHAILYKMFIAKEKAEKNE